MSRASSTSTRRVYGVALVCRIFGVARSTFYDQRQRIQRPASERVGRRGPKSAVPDDVVVAKIREILEASPFHGEGYRKVRARLRQQKMNISRGRVRRLMRENGLQAPHRVGKPRGPRTHDGTIRASRPDLMWGTDMTLTVTVNEGVACIFAAIDHCTGECMGTHASTEGTRFEALEPIRQAVRKSFGRYASGVATGLSIRHDNGSQYHSKDFQDELRFLGMTSSPSFVRSPEGNGMIERFFRTLKENLLWVQHFETVEDLRKALILFQEQYNSTWMLERFGYQTPAQVRASFQDPLLKAA